MQRICEKNKQLSKDQKEEGEFDPAAFSPDPTNLFSRDNVLELSEVRASCPSYRDHQHHHQHHQHSHQLHQQHHHVLEKYDVCTLAIESSKMSLFLFLFLEIICREHLNVLGSDLRVIRGTSHGCRRTRALCGPGFHAPCSPKTVETVAEVLEEVE